MLERISDRKIVIGLMLLQLLICVPFISSYPIDLDEPFSIFWAQQDISDMMGMFEHENNPPLHFLLLHFWIKAFGIKAFSVRFLSLIFSALTIPVLFRLSKKVHSSQLGLIVCLFFIFSTFNHYHAIEARVYSLLVLLVVLIFHDVHTFIFSNRKVFWRLAIWNTLLLYSHYLGAFIIGCEVLILLFFIRELKTKAIVLFMVSGLITALCYLPGLFLLIKRLGQFSDHGTWVPEPHWTEIYGNVFRFMNYTLVFFILLGLLLVFAVLNRTNFKENSQAFLKNKHVRFSLLCFGIPFFGMYVFSIVVQPVFLDRYLLYTTPFLYLSFALIAAYLLQQYSKKWLIGLLVIPMMASCYYIPQTNREGDEVALHVDDYYDNETLIMICPPFYDLTFCYHFNQEAFMDYKNFEENKRSMNIQAVYNVADLSISNSVEQLVFIDAASKFLYPDNTIVQDLDNRFTFISNESFKGDLVVYRYQIK